MQDLKPSLVSGDEAVAWAALDCGISLGTGYPGTPSTEILEHFDKIGGRAQWAPNEKVAFEVALGAAFGFGRALVTMKHVGLNVAADPLFTAAYTGVQGALIIVSADDPGMASSQNEQDNRRYAEAAGVPMFEPADSQETYDLFAQAILVSEQWHIPVLFRMTTRVCHSKSILQRSNTHSLPPKTHFIKDPASRVMIPSNAKPAHQRLRQKLAEITDWCETAPCNYIVPGNSQLGIITNGISFMHAREAAPDATILKLGMVYPLPLRKIREFVSTVKRALVIEEGDPFFTQAICAEAITVEGKPAPFRFGELTVDRVRRIINHDLSPETKPLPGKPPQLCLGCPHRITFELLNRLQAIVAGDIGCYALGVLPPFSAMDTCVCMGASIGVGLGLRHVLPDTESRRVVSVIGDSTFMHSGITGLVEMVYNPPKTGHVVVILDNRTTAMTGLQEHPGTGRQLNGNPSHEISIEAIARALGVLRVEIVDPQTETTRLETLLTESQTRSELLVIICRRTCILVAGNRTTPAATGTEKEG